MSFIKSRSRSGFENYQNFQAWEQTDEQTNCNLLQRFNTNLYLYENNYKKFMSHKQTRASKNQELPPLNQSSSQTINCPPTSDNSIPKDSLLPHINSYELNFITKSENLKTPKVAAFNPTQLTNQDIFCDRTNTNLKNMTISYDKNFKQRFSIKKRKFSTHQKRTQQIQTSSHKKNIQEIEQKQNIETGSVKGNLDFFNKIEGYGPVRHLFKKSNNLHRIFNHQTNSQLRCRQEKRSESILRKKISCFTKDPLDETSYAKFNEFSDKKFYEVNIKERFYIHR